MQFGNEMQISLGIMEVDNRETSGIFTLPEPLGFLSRYGILDLLSFLRRNDLLV